MATSDLARVLQSEDCILDDFESKRVVNAILSRLNDTSGDISGLANTCLGALVTKVGSVYIQEICRVLLEQMKSEKDPMKRDVAYLALKSVIGNISNKEKQNSSGKNVIVVVAECLGPWLLDCIHSEEEEVASNGYDLLLMFLMSHGPIFPNIAGMADVCIKESETPRPGIQKKALQCLGKLAASLPVVDFDSHFKRILARLENVVRGTSCLKVAEIQQANALLITLASMGRGAGYRMGKHTPETISMCLVLIPLAKTGDDEGVQLVESCLLVLELCVTVCPQHSAGQRDAINSYAISCLSFDPNYSFDSDMESAGEGTGSDDDNSDSEYSDDGFSDDDDDDSWKVRRAACKVISAEISSYASQISDVYASCHPVLVKRLLSEREDTVRQEMFKVYQSLLETIVESNDRALKDSLDNAIEPAALKLAKLLKKHPAKMKTCVFKTLTQMVVAKRSIFSVIMSSLAQDMTSALSDESSSSLQLQVLELLVTGFQGWQLDRASTPGFVQVAEVALECTRKKYFALSVLSLRVCEKMVYLIRPNIQEPVTQDTACLVLPLFVTLMDVLSCPDKSQEVKNAAIQCSGHAISQMGDLLEGTQVEALAKDFAAMPSNSKRAKIQGSNDSNTGHLPRLKDIVSILIERLGNETTRLSALVALKQLIEAPLNLEIQGSLGDALSVIRSYLRKNDRQVRITSVETISSIMKCCAAQLDQAEIHDIIDEVSGLISDDDLGVSNAAINLLGETAVSSPELAASILQKSSNSIHVLLSSTTLQASSLEKLTSFFGRAICYTPDPKRVTKDLIDFGVSAGAKHTSTATAKCVACLGASSEASLDDINVRLGSMNSTKDPHEINFLLYCVKELGAMQIMLKNDDLLCGNVTACMEEEFSMEAAAAALGGLASGTNISHLEFILSTLSDSTKKGLHYPMVRALNEALKIMSRARGTSMDNSKKESCIDNIVQMLINMNSDNGVNEEVYAIISECYGFASLICPDTVLPTYQMQLESPSASSNIMALVALKTCVSESDEHLDSVLGSSCIPTAMKKLSDSNVSVRRSASLLLGLTAHSKLELIKPSLPDYIPPLLHQTLPDESLVRTIDLGPFKHKIDDGLEQRKSAFDCLGILINKCWDDIPNHESILEAIVKGVADVYEVKLKCHDLLTAVSHLDPSAVLAVLDKVVEPFTKTLSKRIKSDTVRQEVDKNEDMIRSCLRTVDVLHRLQGADNVATFKTFVGNISGDDFLGPRFASLQRERKQLDGV
jgi:cullin-associated NEDD8-dissociated protein 1